MQLDTDSRQDKCLTLLAVLCICSGAASTTFSAASYLLGTSLVVRHLLHCVHHVNHRLASVLFTARRRRAACLLALSQNFPAGHGNRPRYLACLFETLSEVLSA